MPGEPVLLYDGDCAFCSSTVDWGRRRGLIRPPLTAIPWQRADLAALRVKEQQVRDEVIYRDATGRVSGGAAAVTALLKDQGGPAAATGRVLGLPPVRPLAGLVYRLVAANRHRLPGGTPACARPPDDDDAGPGSRRGTMER